MYVHRWVIFFWGGGKRWVLPDIHTFNIKKIIASGKKNCVKIHVRSTGDALKTCRVEICSTRVAPCHPCFSVDTSSSSVLSFCKMALISLLFWPKSFAKTNNTNSTAIQAPKGSNITLGLMLNTLGCRLVTL